MKTPPAADLTSLAELVRSADAALDQAAKDFGENNFGLAAGGVARAQEALREVSRVRLPLAVVSQYVYTADVNLRFADAPERALAELEAARDFLAETLLDAGTDERELLSSFLDRLIGVIDDTEVGREEKLSQLEALQRDLATAVQATAGAGVK
ncbi:MAG TPA: hypothetical protein VM054_06845 [bacterium]|nr:hypothetical protein [bacterium]